MGKVATTTTAPTRTAPNTGPNWRRIIRRLVTAGILSVAAAALAYERDKWLPPLLDHWLPDAYVRVRGQPLAIQIGAAVFVLDILLAAAIFVIRDQILRAREAAEAAQTEDARQRENVRIGVTEANAPEFAQVKAGQAAMHDDVRDVRDRVVALADTLTRDAPPIPTTVAAPGGLPRPASLLGRDHELTALMRDLRDQDALTPAPIGVFALHGMGGIGKTALAAEAVARLSADRAAFPGGAAWISCEALHGAEGLAELWSRVARALGLSEIAALPDADARRAALAAALAARPRTLLALDNLEPDLDAYAALDTLAGGGGGRIALLLTARQPVAADRLRAVALPPLPVPDAATLFTQRLAQADPTRPTADDLPHIPALAAAVGALPLALEQLAAYAGAQKRPLATLAAELARDGISAAAFRANPTRALAATFDRSWEVLPPRQRRLFAGLALLAGASFPRTAALAPAAAATVVVAEGEPADPEADTAALVTYALVEPLANDRLRLHPLLREYAAAKLHALGPAVEAPLGDALLAYWLAYAEAHPGYDGMDALEAEAPGLMGALEWAHEHQRDRDVLALAAAVRLPWRVRGRRDDQLRMYSVSLQSARRLGDVQQERWAAHQLAVAQADVGRLTEARAGFARALALARQLGDPAAERAETHELAVLDAQTGHIEQARAGYERALAIAQRLGDPAAERAETHALAAVDFAEGDIVAAKEGYERALEIAHRLGDPSKEALELISLGDTIRYLGETIRARELILKGIEINTRLDDVYMTGKSYELLARLDEQEGNRDEVIAHYREALRRLEQVQSPDAEDARAALRRLGAKP